MAGSGNCITSETSRIYVVAPNPAAYSPAWTKIAISTLGAKFQVSCTKLYVTVVTLFMNNNIKVLENLRQGFERTISWNKHRFEN